MNSSGPSVSAALQDYADVAPGARTQLAKILASRTFQDSELLSRFLTYVVEQTLSGGGDQLKEYKLGTEVFGRSTSFDPRIDPVVRVSALRLRNKLKEYYEQFGQNDPVRIDVPKGGYVAVITRNSPPSEQKQAVAEAKPARSRTRITILAIFALLLLCVVAALVAYLLTGKNHKLSAEDTILLADFSNSTGDAIFDDALQTALRISLQQSPFLNLLSEEKVASTLQLMTRPAGTKLTPEVAREVCERSGSRAYIAGAIGSLGTDYILRLKAVNCQTGNTVAEEQTAATSKEKVLEGLGNISAKLRGELGESLATVQKYDVPLVAATTSSLEALKVFSIGQKVYHERGPEASLPFDLKAIAIDPDFALAYFQAGSDYHSLYQVARARDCIIRAYQLRERASEREKLAIEAFYYRNVTGELEKAVATDQEEIASYPREQYGYIRLGVDYATLGQWEKARDATLQATRLVPDHSVAVGNLASIQLALQNFDGVRQLIHQAKDQNIDNIQFHTALYAIAFLNRDLSATEQQEKWFAGTSDEAIGLALASDTESYGGQLITANQIAERALNSAIRNDSKETGAVWDENNALRDAAYGFPMKARREAEAGLKLAPDSVGVQVEAGLAFAMAWDRSRAEEVVRNLNQHFPADTQVQSLWLPAIRAQFALDRHDASAALQSLQAASAIELGLTPFTNNLSCLNAVYLRGEAELQAEQGAAAAAEFQKIIDHGGLVWNCWTGALAKLGVARAHALEAGTSASTDVNQMHTRARADYEDFLQLWKNADPDIPILKAAKAEYANLRQ